MRGGIDDCCFFGPSVFLCSECGMSTREMGTVHPELSTSFRCLTFRALWFECYYFPFGGVSLALMDGWETRGELGQRVYRVGARRAVYD